MLNNYEVLFLEKGIDLAPIYVEGYCVNGEQIMFNTTPEAIDELHCFTNPGYERLQKEVLERYRKNDHSNDELLFAMLRKELSEHKDNLNQSILLNGLINDGSFDLLIKEYLNTELYF